MWMNHKRMSDKNQFQTRLIKSVCVPLCFCWMPSLQQGSAAFCEEALQKEKKKEFCMKLKQTPMKWRQVRH